MTELSEGLIETNLYKVDLGTGLATYVSAMNWQEALRLAEKCANDHTNPTMIRSMERVAGWLYIERDANTPRIIREGNVTMTLASSDKDGFTLNHTINDGE